MKIYPDTLIYKEHTFSRKECRECSATFWHTLDDVTFCGSDKCNRMQLKSNVTDINLTLPKLISQYNSYFLSHKDTLFKRTHIMIRPRMSVKHTTTNMHFLCAGVSAYESLSSPDALRLNHFARDLFVSNIFCFRFLDRANVGATKTHSTGFFMAGLHCFEGESKFNADWKASGVNLILSYFIDCLKFDPSTLYLHADSWSDGKKGGPSVELYIGGLELANCVFTERDIESDSPLQNRYIDVGIGIERILRLITTKDSLYFNNPDYDHLRTIIVGFKDKLYPSKIGVGYNLRKLCEAVLKRYQQDMPRLESDLRLVYAELDSLLPGENFQDQTEILRSLSLMKDELNRCMSSHIL